jgi:ACR3 family arsenite efflux pump ArsB
MPQARQGDSVPLPGFLAGAEPKVFAFRATEEILLMSLLSKLQPVFIILSALLGVAAGKLSPFAARHAGGCVEIFLVMMLFFVFLAVNIREITRSFADPRFAVSSLAVNFIWTPVFTLLLSRVFLPGQTDLQIGFIMLMVTPCTDWYLIFTGLANGSVALASSILPLNLVLQILLLPAYLLLFMGAAVSFDAAVIARSIALVLLAPMLSANLAKIIFTLTNRRGALEKILAKSDDAQFLLLCLAIVSMFASQGSLMLSNMGIFLSLLPPLMIFFAVNFALVLWIGKKLRFAFRDVVPLIFTTSARNSPISLAIAAITFPSRPIISLALVMGPLIELPVLAINASILKKLGDKK